MADTRAGVWLLGLTVFVTAAFMVIFFFVADSEDRIFGNFIGIAATPQGFVLPVLGILLITSEWGQRTAMVTFALEPSRTKVIAREGRRRPAPGARRVRRRDRARLARHAASAAPRAASTT